MTWSLLRALTTPLRSSGLLLLLRLPYTPGKPGFKFRSSGLLLLLRLQHARGDREPSRTTGTGHLPREQVQRTVVAGLRPLSRLTLQHTHDVVSFSVTLHRDTFSWFMLYVWLSCCMYGYHVVYMVIMLYIWLSCCIYG